MSSKKKVEAASSTDSSSGSSSDSSSSSSSSGSDSSSSSDSESTASEQGTKPPPAETKKVTAVQKSPRKSTDTAKNYPLKGEKPKPKALAPKTQKTTTNTYAASNDDDAPKGANGSKMPAKRKPMPKPKTAATITPKPSSKPAKPPPKSAEIAKASKPPVRSKPNVKAASKTDASKKKSIFSPENSSESDEPSTNNNAKLTAMKTQLKSCQKPRTKAAPRTLHEKKRTPDKPKPAPPPPPATPKPKIESSASTETSTTATNSSSDSDSSSNSSSTSTKNVKTIKKPPGMKIKDSNSDSDDSQKVTKKLTRSSSARKSKHLFGKNNYSDSDSDTESTKRSLSRSPVKRTAVATKGKAKNSKNKQDAKSHPNEIPIITERKCPVEGCTSQGHLGGRQEKHFTVEACPLYHNMTAQQCKDQHHERKKREEFRRKAMEVYRKSPRTHPTPEQKAYLHKVKEMRAKFKAEACEDIKPIVDKNKEPNLANIVPDYDLKLFKDAQAIASDKIEEDLKALPNTKATKYIEMGKFEMEVWYQSPYPDDYARLPKLYICEFCLRYIKSRTVLQRHVVKCVWRHPPGEEVYRKDKISVWEVDGKRYKQYCQNLCLLAKFFLDHKTLYYDVEPFLFYVMTMGDSEGCHTVGYFSKEKNSFLNYNVSCILTLPPYQRQGYGRLLIDFSYLLTRVEGKVGSPEKPLSDLGLISYRSYWKDVLLGYLCSRPGTTLSVKDISQEMAIHSYDIVSTLQALGMMKYWKGKHIILKKQDVLDEYVERVNRQGSLLKEVDPSCLRWKPFVPPQPAPV